MSTPSTDDQIKEWQERAAKLTTKDLKAIEGPLGELDAHLTLRSHIVGYSLTDADTTVWRALRENHKAYSFIKQGLLVNVSRWFKYIEAINPSVVLPQRPAKAPKSADDKTAAEDGGSFDIGLQDVSGGVITRFPPEPS